MNVTRRLLAAILLVLASAATAPALAEGWRVLVDDRTTPPPASDPAWTSLPDHDEHAGVRWYAHEVTLARDLPPGESWSITVVGLDAAWELFWDGDPVATNGTVAGDPVHEVPGRWMATATLPSDAAGPGVHTLAIRASAAHGSSAWEEPQVEIVPTVEWDAFRNESERSSAIMLGVFVMAAVYGFALFLGGGRQRPHLLWSLHLLTCIAGVVTCDLGFRTSVSAHVMEAWLRVYPAVSPIGGVLLVAFVVRVFEVPRARWHELGVTIVAVGTLLTLGMMVMVFTVLSHVTLIVGWAVIDRRTGARPALVGVVAMVAGVVVELMAAVPYAEYWNAAGLVLFIFAMAISTSRQLRWQNQRQEEATLRSSRLEADLLKRSIQPHFVMNTLLSIMSWIRRDPETASRLIQSLAAEFRAINRASSRSTIPLEDEIQLCRNHLELMGYRNDASYELRADEPTARVDVPPLLLHTLVENGLTHAFGTGESGAFELHCEEDADGWISFRLRNGGSRLHKLRDMVEETVEEGLGLRYVRARLQERYPDGWNLDYGLDGDHWETRIRVFVGVGS